MRRKVPTLLRGFARRRRRRLGHVIARVAQVADARPGNARCQLTDFGEIHGSTDAKKRPGMIC